MSKSFKIIIVIILLAVISWFLPIIPFYSGKISGIPGCKPFYLTTLKHVFNLNKNEKELYRKFKPNSIVVIYFDLDKCSYN